MSSEDGKFLYGTCWLHFWIFPAPHATELALAIQWEQVGIAISAAPYVMMRPTQAAKLLDKLAVIPGAIRDENGVSIKLGE